MSEVTMLRVQQGEQVFNLRASAVVTHEGHVLLHRAKGDPFWTMPGGKIQMGETGAETVRREMQEEIRVDVEVDRLLYVSEEFFDYNDSRMHEIGLYYAVNLPEGTPLLDKTQAHRGEEDGELLPLELVFQWFPLDGLAKLDLPLFPAALVTRLNSLPSQVEHIIRMED